LGPETVARNPFQYEAVVLRPQVSGHVFIRRDVMLRDRRCGDLLEHCGNARLGRGRSCNDSGLVAFWMPLVVEGLVFTPRMVKIFKAPECRPCDNERFA